MLHGHGQVGAVISSHMNIRALSFTGSTRTGRAIQIAAANSNLKKVVFELGGKGPAVIFEDADIEAAVIATENSINFNAGQTCMANSRIYVQESIAAKYIEKFQEIARKRKIGDPLVSGINHGPLADKVQLDTVIEKVAQNTQLTQEAKDASTEALNVANGHNDKIRVATEIANKALEQSQL